MQAIQLLSYGEPLDNLVCAEVPAPAAPKKGEVLIDMQFAPINSSDLLLAKGSYAKKPQLPSIIGGEGVGVVRQLGSGVVDVQVGDHVLVSATTFTWAEQVIAPAASLVQVPQQVDLLQAAMLSINPPAAFLLLSEYLNLNPGDWVIQNAANSGVGRCVIAFAKLRGLKTINIVRRAELARELKNAGADVILLDSDDIASLAKTAVDGGNIRLALDGLGGEASKVLSEVLSTNGRLVAYAGSQKTMQINAQKMIFNKISINGFFMYHPEHASKLKPASVEAVELLRTNQLHVPVAATYPLTSIRQAIEHAQKGGKVLLSLTKQ